MASAPPVSAESVVIAALAAHGGTTPAAAAAAQAAGTFDAGNAADLVQTCGSQKAALGLAPPTRIEFKCPAGANANEFARQLLEQQTAINSLDPVKLEAQRAKVKAKGTAALRDQQAQRDARNQYAANRVAELIGQNMAAGQSPALAKSNAEAQTAAEMKKLDATHALDIVAGGDPSIISDLGSSRINRSIGSQWRKNVSDLDVAVASAKTANAAKMNVQLVIVP